MAKNRPPRPPARAGDAPHAVRGNGSHTSASFPMVGVGASAGGLEAFTELLKALPLDTGMGFVLVQHLDPEHESALTQILTRATSMPVREVTNNLRVEANCVYIIPPNTNLTIAQGVLKLEPRQKTRTPTRSIDYFFEALAADQRERSIGVILSGTATDGTLGLEAIKAEGGITFAQDDSAKYDSMPRSAAAAGCVDFVLSPENIAKELARIARHPYVSGVASSEGRVASEEGDSGSPEDDRAEATAHEDDDSPLPSGGSGAPPTGAKQARAEAERSEDDASTDSPLTTRPSPLPLDGFKKIVLLLRNHSGVDFSLYKSTTIQRRITRRLVLNKQDTPEDYAGFLRGNSKELDALYSDVLISVTSFFRNPEAFDLLKHKVFPKLLQQRGDEPVRVWVLGCSTGQEAYSIAMAFVESAEKASRLHKLQVFATDLNETLLDKARHGLYAKSLAQDIAPERLRRFFTEEEGGYRVNKALREMVVFARQNLIADPPFSRMDLISCRNLLIYLEPSLQKKALPTFHYALKPGGFLLLGASESVGSFTELFEPVDKKHKIYAKKAALTAPLQLPVKKDRGEPSAPAQRRRAVLPMGQADAPEGFRGELSAQREADRVAVNQFAPPGVLINAELQILQFRGPTGAYLEPPTGKASFDVLKMAREGLMLPLRAAINKAKKDNTTARKENVRIKQDGTTRSVNLEVIPLKNLRERCFLVVFEDAERAEGAAAGAASNEPAQDGARQPPRGKPAKGKAATGKQAESRRNAELEAELVEIRDYLQSIQEQNEAANEELQALNEEVQSANEELQSVNEELETSKEELESANEELTTVNEEMSNRNTELNRLNSDLVNLQISTKLAIVLLGRDLTIRRFSSQAEKQFDLLAADIGRPITHIRHKLVFGSDGVESAPDLEGFIAEVIANVRERQREVQDKDGRWYSLRVRPYMTLDNGVDGVVLVLVDISDLKRTEQAIAAARDYAAAIVQTTRDPLVILNADMRVDSANEAFYSTFKISSSEVEGRSLYDLSNRQWDIPKLRQLLEDVLPRNSFFNNIEITHAFQGLGQRTMLLNARALAATPDQPARVLLGIEDVTELLQFQAAMRRSEIRYRRLFEAARDGVLIIDPATRKIIDANPFMTELLGYTHNELLGKELFEIGLLKDEAASRAAFRELQKKGVIRYDDLPLETETGQRRAVEFVSNLYDEDGEQVIQCNIRDITERKQAESNLRDSEERYRNLFDLGPVAVYSCDAAGVIQNFNARAAELWGREPARGDSDERFCGSFKMFRPDGTYMPHDRCPMAEVLSGAMPRCQDGEVHIQRPDGSWVVVIVSIRPLKNEHGEITGAINCFYDITERKQHEQALRDSEQRYRDLFNSMDEGYCIIEMIFDERERPVDYRFVKVNPVFEKQSGMHDVLGKRMLEFVSEIEDHWLANYGNVALTGEPIRFANEYKTLGRWFDVYAFRVGDPDSRRVAVLFTDITEHKRADAALREAEERFRNLADNIPQLAWIADAGTDGQVHWFNQNWFDYTGTTLEQMRGQGWHVVHHPEHAERVIQKFAHHVREGLDWEDTFPLRGKHGQYRWFLSRMKVIRDESGAVVRIFGTNTDVTEQRQMADTLRQNAADMAEADHRKNEFLALLAHELRNPLAPIRNAVQVLKMSSDDGSAVASSAEMMERQIGQMVRLVDDLLDVSRISRNKIELRKGRIELASVVHHVVEAVRTLVQVMDHDLTVAVPPQPIYLNADPTRLAQVVGNLLNNACKFTESGGRIWLTLERDGEQAVIRVRDSGIGIAADQLPRIFEMFVQVDTSLERSVSGLGIGLSLVKSLVELHDGTIEVHSAGIGQGSEFVVRLPMLSDEGRVASGEQESASLATHPSPLATSPSRRVLVVDDNRDSAMTLTMLLKLSGNEIHTAYDGLEAVEAAETFKPHVVLLDIGLPKLNGYEACRRIREQQWSNGMILVALTGWGQEEDRKKSREAGFDSHMVKPVHLAALTKLLAELEQSASRHQPIADS